MKIVIDISKRLYTDIRDSWSITLGSKNTDKVIKAIKKGTPLPKGHGRLIDADELHHKIGEWLKLSRSQKAAESVIETVMVALDDIAISTMMEIEEAPTIIEADRGE